MNDLLICLFGNLQRFITLISSSKKVGTPGWRAGWRVNGNEEEGGGINSVGMRVCPVRSVQRTILNGFCKVMRFDGFGIRQIGNGSGDFQYSVIGPSGQPQPFHGVFHQTIPVTIEFAISPDFSG